MAVTDYDQLSLGELGRRLTDTVTELVHKQIELAKQEVREAKDHAIDAAKRLAIGAGITAAAGLLLVIWLWTAVIWFFNWLGAFISIGPVTLAWLGWVVGLVVPLGVAFLAYKRFIQAGIAEAKRLWPPLPRTRVTLKEDLEWVKSLRTRSVR